MTICLQLDHVNYSYGAAKIRVLSDVNADFESGKMYAITGPSGAGKSTLLSLWPVWMPPLMEWFVLRARI